MTRTAARELAVLLCASLSPRGELRAPEEAAEAVELLFLPSHYETLAGEAPVFDAQPDARQLDYIRALTELVTVHREALDETIARYAQGWKVERLSSVTASILRCAVAEIRYVADVPPGAAIDEAVELAKRYEDEGAPAFINGILGAFVRDEGLAGEA